MPIDQDDLNNKLFKAAKVGDRDDVEELLAAGADIHADGDKALTWAASEGHAATVQLLLIRGADPHIRNGAPLAVAGVGSHLEAMELLLPYANASEKAHALDMAVMYDQVQSVSLLLSHGADVRANDSLLKDVKSETVLKLLLDSGADARAKIPYGSALLNAVGCKKTEMVRMLLEAGADVHEDDDSALIQAAKMGNTEMVKFLLANGADVNAKECNAVMWATGDGHFEIVDILINNGADIRKYGHWPLVAAWGKDHNAIAALLLANGADIHAENNYVLLWTAKNGNEKAVRELLKHIALEGMLGHPLGAQQAKNKPPSAPQP